MNANVIKRAASLQRSLERQLNKENYDQRLEDFIQSTLIDLSVYQVLFEEEKAYLEYQEAHEALLADTFSR